MGTSKPKKGSTSLKLGRPPLLSSRSSQHVSGSIKPSSRATRTLIRAHHNLHKSRAKALSDNNHALVASIDAEIERLGGLEAYQAASLTGQSKDRGGDSSSVLVNWLREYGLVGDTSKHRSNMRGIGEDIEEASSAQQGLRVLEVGALSGSNAISAMIGKGIGLVKRIDLHSQDPDAIEEIDFMEFPIPTTTQDKYDVLSLSLVLNYVPDARGRGEMLKRTRSYLRSYQPREQSEKECSASETALPCLFVVLPLPCIVNSRYMTTFHFRELLSSLGYKSIQMRQSAKLHYELFRYSSDRSNGLRMSGKVEINPGKGRNNFSIVVDAP